MTSAAGKKVGDATGTPLVGYDGVRGVWDFLPGIHVRFRALIAIGEGRDTASRGRPAHQEVANDRVSEAVVGRGATVAPPVRTSA